MTPKQRQEILARAKHAADHLDEHPEVLERILEGVISGIERINLTRELCGITQDYFDGEAENYKLFYESFLRNE